MTKLDDDHSDVLHDRENCEFCTLQFMKHPSEWPYWPLLPMKSQWKAGFIIEHPVGMVLPTVYVVNIVQMAIEGLVDITPKQLRQLPHIKYMTFEAIYNHGWRPD